MTDYAGPSFPTFLPKSSSSCRLRSSIPLLMFHFRISEIYRVFLWKNIRWSSNFGILNSCPNHFNDPLSIQSIAVSSHLFYMLYTFRNKKSGKLMDLNCHQWRTDEKMCLGLTHSPSNSKTIPCSLTRQGLIDFSHICECPSPCVDLNK